MKDYKINSAEEALAAVKQNPSALRHVPKAFMTPEICLAAVQEAAWTLTYVPTALKTPEICLTAVKEYGSALEYVPESLKTPELCLAAVQNGGWALQYVPEALKTQKLCLAAVQNGGWALEYVPEALKTQKLCLAAVQNVGWVLKYVPESLKTPELCLAAIQISTMAIEYMPEELKTLEFCRIAIQENPWMLQYVPETLKTPEIYRAAVQAHGGMLQYVPDALKTREICRIAVQKNIWALKHVPEEFKTSCQALQNPDSEVLPNMLASGIHREFNGLSKSGSLRIDLPGNAGHMRVRSKRFGYRSYVLHGKTWRKEVTDFSLLHEKRWMYNEHYPISRFFSELPTEIVSGPSPFFSDQLAMAQLCAISPRALQMLRDSPVLFWFLTPYLHQFPGVDGKAIQQLLGEKRYILLSRFFPQAEPWVARFIQQLPKPRDCDAARNRLADMLAHQNMLGVLRHCRKPTWELLALSLKEECPMTDRSKTNTEICKVRDHYVFTRWVLPEVLYGDPKLGPFFARELALSERRQDLLLMMWEISQKKEPNIIKTCSNGLSVNGKISDNIALAVITMPPPEDMEAYYICVTMPFGRYVQIANIGYFTLEKSRSLPGRDKETPSLPTFIGSWDINGNHANYGAGPSPETPDAFVERVLSLVQESPCDASDNQHSDEEFEIPTFIRRQAD
ncbi:MAG: DUF4116 domain-containing protein [Desulfovibrionaceae bacterium]|nr:DUF4116 domain-containing protein [Desulfovibrionaceae bacterium]